MISSIIQILAIALLFYALYRETKRDRLNELRKREELQDPSKPNRASSLRNSERPTLKMSLPVYKHLSQTATQWHLKSWDKSRLFSP